MCLSRENAECLAHSVPRCAGRTALFLPSAEGEARALRRIEADAARCLRRMAKKSPMARVSRFVVHSSAGKGEDFLEKAGDFRRKVPCFFQFRLSLRKWERMCGQTAVGESRHPVGRTENKEQKMRRERRHREGAEDMPPRPTDKKIPALTTRAGMGN